jgi:hypothetical protein
MSLPAALWWLLVLSCQWTSQVNGDPALQLTYPPYPEENMDFEFSWTGGTPPYIAYVLTPDLKTYLYKYNGTSLSTFWFVQYWATL